MRILSFLLALVLALPAFAADSTTKAQPEKDVLYTCKYYAVQLPDGWKAIIPPTEQQGTVNAIFATAAGSSVVTMIVGQSGGEDAQTIATMFAEQFKAARPPVQKNGQYTFTFQNQNSTATAYVATQDGEFMVTTIMGNLNQGRNFIAKNITSASYGSLLPK